MHNAIAKALKITVTVGAALKDFNFAAGLFSKDAHLKAIEGTENAESPSYNRVRKNWITTGEKSTVIQFFHSLALLSKLKRGIGF
ncbi:hypothetical protein [Faecalispora jeddahensis]|uniref:hypothetical protein n=1 Tax=Faecalispora jeddahensis TaxID=1414721 RepID=UPI0027B92B48|nr:hypothetical protein [Faecalispora jeddahensis]